MFSEPSQSVFQESYALCSSIFLVNELQFPLREWNLLSK